LRCAGVGSGTSGDAAAHHAGRTVPDLRLLCRVAREPVGVEPGRKDPPPHAASRTVCRRRARLPALEQRWRIARRCELQSHWRVGSTAQPGRPVCGGAAVAGPRECVPGGGRDQLLPALAPPSVDLFTRRLSVSHSTRRLILAVLVTLLAASTASAQRRATASGQSG